MNTPINYLTGLQIDKNMKMFIEDAMKFVTTFFQPISQSTPHIHLSALPMLPSDSLIAQKYSCHFTGVVTFEKGEQISWPSINSILQGHAFHQYLPFIH